MNSKDDKRERFKKMGEQRTNEVLKRLKILGNCSNKNLYDYEDEDMRKIFAAIDAKVKEIKGKFQRKKEKDFKL